MFNEDYQALRLRLVYLIMCRLLFLAIGLGMLLPTASNAESYWLIMSAGDADKIDMEKVQMEDLGQCKEQGQIFKSLKTARVMKYVCIKGK